MKKMSLILLPFILFFTNCKKEKSLETLSLKQELVNTKWQSGLLETIDPNGEIDRDMDARNFSFKDDSVTIQHWTFNEKTFKIVYNIDKFTVYYGKRVEVFKVIYKDVEKMTIELSYQTKIKPRNKYVLHLTRLNK